MTDRKSCASSVTAAQCLEFDKDGWRAAVPGRAGPASADMTDAGRLLLAAAVAFLASTLGGITGFGTGLALPAFVAPIVGVTSVVPVLAVAMLFNNGGRILAFRSSIDHGRAVRILLSALPACVAGAWGYAQLDARLVSIVVGTFLLLAVPIRRALARAHRTLSPCGERLAGAAFGFINGGVPGAGVLLIDILMSSGLGGSTLVATDAVV